LPAPTSAVIVRLSAFSFHPWTFDQVFLYAATQTLSQTKVLNPFLEFSLIAALAVFILCLLLLQGRLFQGGPFFLAC
jgi:hypothetical protein